MPRAPRNATLACLTAVLLAYGVAVTVFPSAVAAQESAAEDATPIDDGSSQRMLIEARRLTDGRTEFALRPHDAGDVWEDLILPGRRFFPVEAATERWVVSRPITLRLAPEEPAGRGAQIWVRITARRLADVASSSGCSSAPVASGCCRRGASSHPPPMWGAGWSARR